MSNENPMQVENCPSNTPLRRIGRFALVALCLIVAYVFFRPLLPLLAGKNQTTRFATPTDQYDSQNPFTLHFSLSENAQGNTFMLTLDQISGEELSQTVTSINGSPFDADFLHVRNGRLSLGKTITFCHTDGWAFRPKHKFENGHSGKLSRLAYTTASIFSNPTVPDRPEDMLCLRKGYCHV